MAVFVTRQAPDFSNIPPEEFNQTRAPAIIAASVATLVFASIFVIARIVSRAFILRTWKIDDWLLLAAWFGGLGLTIITFLACKNGAGRHIFAISLSETVTQLKLALASRLLYNTTILLTKASICVFYLRIFQQNRGGRISIITCLIFLCLCYVPLQLGTIFQCKPIVKLWALPPSPPQYCISDHPLFWLSAISNIISDIWLIAAVFPRILELKLHTQQKAALLLIVSMGLLVVAASIARAVRIASLFNSADQDLPWTSYDIQIWSSVEYNIGIFCASAPAIRPLVRRLIPQALRTYAVGTRSKFSSTTAGRTSKYASKHFELSNRTNKDSEPSASQTNLAGYGTEGKIDWTVNVRGDVEADGFRLDSNSNGDQRDRGPRDGSIVKTSTVLVTSGAK